MKRILLSAPSKLTRFYFKTLSVLLLTLGLTNVSNSQCNSYQHYNSGTVPAGYTNSGFTATTVPPAATGNVGRTGQFSLTSPNNGQYVETPSVATPDVFSFWMRRGTGGSNTTAYIDLQVFNVTTSLWESLRNTAALANYGITTYSANMITPLTGLTLTYQQFWVKFDGTPQPGYTNSNLIFRIVNNKGAFSGTIFLDDISWSSRTASQNDTFVPAMVNSPGTSACTSSLTAGSTYTLYDVGGEFDNYHLGQNNTTNFQPSAGDKIEITFVSFNTNADPNDYISVLDGATPVLTNYTGTDNPGTVTYTGTINNTMTLQFISDNVGTTTSPGFKITVKCIAGSTCSLPGALNAATLITATGATVSWGAASPVPTSGYDIYYSTNPSDTPSVLTTSATTTRALTGLLPETTYYYWVRSNCGGTQSAWVGPSASFTTLCAPINPPYTENFNGLPTSALPQCTSADNAGWQVNTVNGYLTNNIVGTNFFTRAVRLTGGVSYRLSYDYSGALGNLDMKVYYGFTNNAPTTSNIITPLNTHTGVTGLNNNIGNFTPPFTATYYIRFELISVSNAPNTLLIIDNINLIQETCGPGRTLTSSGVTSSSATVSWLVPAAPFSPPVNGYQYYLSTSNVTPTYSVTPTGSTAAGFTSVNLSGLATSTTYYIWVRSNCGGNFSAWSVPTSFTTLVGALPLILDASSNGTTKTDCDYSFFDSGGGTANYQNNENYTVTLLPAIAGTKVKVVFSTFQTENNWDGLSIFNGNSIAAPLINSGLPAGFAPSAPAGSFYGSTSPGTIISTAADGSLTFRFTSDPSVLAPGWSAFVSCVVTPTITSFTPANNNCGASGTVVLTGTNYIGITNVSFGGVSAPYVVNSTTQITATIPVGANSGPISVSNNTATGFSATSFFVLAPPPVTTGVTICAGGTGSISSSTVCNGFVNSGTTIAGTLTAGTDPTAPRPSPPGGNSTTCSFLAGSIRNYQATQFQVSVTGNYIFQMASPYDAMGYITTGSFTPGSCATGTYIIGDDDSNGGLQPRLTVILTAGITYTLYSTSFGGTGNVSGAYTWTISPAAGGQIMLQGNPNMQWYTVATGGSPIGSGATFNPVGVAGSGLANTNTPGTTTYYAACSSNPTCRTATTFVINPRPTVTFTAQPGATACTFNDVTYTTQAGQSNYVWSVPGVLGVDYSIVSGGLDTSSNTVTLQWLTTGVKTVTINYNNASGCPATLATSSTATTVAASGISTTATPSSATICANVPQILTATSGSANFFTWTTTTGALFTNAACTIPYVALTNSATVYFKGIANATVTVLGTVGGTGCAAPASAAININKAVWNGSIWSNAGVGPSNTISAEFQGNFTSSINASATSGNLSACSVVVTSGTVLFDRGTFTVQNAVAVNGGSLTFDDATFDVSLYQPNNVSNFAGVFSGGNTGNITFRRTSSPMYKFDYTYWSSPVHPQNLLAVSPGSPANLFLDYGTAWNYIVSPGTTTMTPAKGYAIRAPLTYPVFPSIPTSYQATFTGLPNNGDLSIPIIIAGGATQMNFLGNPYPSALSGTDFITNGNNTGLGALYFWTHNTPIDASYQYTQNDYAIFNLSGGTIAAPSTPGGAGIQVAPTGNVASGQGFFVKGSNVSANAVFTNSMRLAGNNNQFFRMSNQSLERHRYWLDISNTQGAFKQLLVAYVENATLGNDILFDAEAAEAGNVISLYTKVQSLKMSIEGRPIPFEVSDLVPLAYKSTIASTYTISMPLYDGLFESQHVYLEDNLLNVIHDLTLAPYSFATEIGTFEDRFVLRYTTEALGITPVFNENSVVVYKNEQGLYINSGKEVMQSVTIYDIRGRVIASQKQVNNTETTFTTLPTTQQVLLVKIEGENGITVTKKVVY